MQRRAPHGYGTTKTDISRSRPIAASTPARACWRSGAADRQPPPDELSPVVLGGQLHLIADSEVLFWDAIGIRRYGERKKMGCSLAFRPSIVRLAQILSIREELQQAVAAAITAQSAAAEAAAARKRAEANAWQV